MKKNPENALKRVSTVSVGSLITMGSASASIIHFDTSYITPALSEYDWDVDGDSSIEMTWFTNNTVVDSIFASQAGNSFAFMDGGTAFKNLSSGYLISSGRSFSTYINPMIGNSFYYAAGFSDGVEGIFGFRFKPDDTMLYGWAHVTFDLSANTAYVRDWAFQDDGSAIAAGAIPEPSSSAFGLGMLALGAAGLTQWRRQRKTSSEA